MFQSLMLPTSRVMALARTGAARLELIFNLSAHSHANVGTLGARTVRQSPTS